MNRTYFRKLAYVIDEEDYIRENNEELTLVYKKIRNLEKLYRNLKKEEKLPIEDLNRIKRNIQRIKINLREI